LDAAEGLFAARGYSTTRLEDVAVAVSIKRASLVYHFKDKSTLYQAVLQRLLGRLLERHAEVLAGEGSLAERFERITEGWVSYAEEHPNLLRLMLREMADGLSTEARPFAEQATPLIAVLVRAINHGQENGTFRNIDPLQYMMITTGASVFLTLGRPLLSTIGGEAIATPEEHGRILRGLTRYLLGQPALRSVA
jgi:TetR/AcrR family transcriptional regulator